MNISLCLRLAIFCMLLACCQACSPIMAARQDSYVDVDKIKPGTRKAVVIGNLGSPLENHENEKGEQCEIYKFRQGYSQGAKTGRVMLHTMADFLTLGLWEVVGTPVEATFSGHNLSYEVCYDKDDLVTSIAEIPTR